jgi:hypothetical protein
MTSSAIRITCPPQAGRYLFAATLIPQVRRGKRMNFRAQNAGAAVHGLPDFYTPEPKASKTRGMTVPRESRKSVSGL